MNQYTIVASEDLLELERLVNLKGREGFAPVGGITTRAGHSILYIQPMFRSQTEGAKRGKQ